MEHQGNVWTGFRINECLMRPLEEKYRYASVRQRYVLNMLTGCR